MGFCSFGIFGGSGRAAREVVAAVGVEVGVTPGAVEALGRADGGTSDFCSLGCADGGTSDFCP